MKFFLLTTILFVSISLFTTTPVSAASSNAFHEVATAKNNSTALSGKHLRKQQRHEKRLDRFKQKLEKKLAKWKNKNRIDASINLNVIGLIVLALGGLFIFLGIVIPYVGLLFIIIGALIAFVGLVILLLLDGVRVKASDGSH